MHWKVLARDQAAALGRVGPLMRERGFHLAGGTAIALQIGHRVSGDLDWFAASPDADLARTLADLRRLPRARVESEGERTGLAFVGRTKIDVVVPLFEPLRPPVDAVYEHARFSLAHLEDLAALKIAAVAQRAKRRDFVDLYALGTTHFGLRRMLDLYRKRFKVEDLYHAARSVAFFDQAERDDEPMPRLFIRVTWPRIKATLRQWVEALE